MYSPQTPVHRSDAQQLEPPNSWDSNSCVICPLALGGVRAASTRSERSLSPVIPPIGAAESLSDPGARVYVEPLILQGFRIEAPEGWPPLADRASPLKLWRIARPVGRGVECAVELRRTTSDDVAQIRAIQASPTSIKSRI
jgi:hypothetical protein